MPRDTIFSRSFDKANTSINRSFQLALDKTGRVPIGQQVLDPRTIAKRSAFDPSTIWNPVGQSDSTSMTSDFVAPKPFNFKKNPLPKDPGQNPKIAAAGKVVDPTAIETFQGADSVSVDSAGGQGNTPTEIMEG
jgi:hypothetical protein